jgi:hypothetical protein
MDKRYNHCSETLFRFLARRLHKLTQIFQVLTAASMKFTVFWDVVTLKLTDVSEVRPASIIALMMEAIHTSETSVNLNLTTRSYIPKDSTSDSQTFHGFIQANDGLYPTAFSVYLTTLFSVTKTIQRRMKG